ncbi:uncharacterized protein DEA37_0001064 [Paragonimus westermani]|uniref:Uncharacterized protein n=1 Tax=Paragonimus westermani TaxID=34504 RepID=A0A5J4NPB9_9TREM|nr:uncharacterized protein DEA37_0001064 [Paragonimus westermani]
MAFIETNPEKLNALNEDARQKENKPLGFLTSPLDVVTQVLDTSYGSKKPFETGQGFPYTYKPGGNFLHRPLLDVPNLYLGMTWFSMQGPFKPRFCHIMERDYYRCVTRVGLQNNDKLCKIYWDDLLECQTRDKARKRAMFMKKVRNQKKLPPMTDIPYGAYIIKSY